MKKYTIAAALFLSTVASLSHAAPPPGGTRFAIGLASDEIFISPSSKGGLTGLLILAPRSALQMYFGITSVTAGVELGGGANYKYSLAGDAVKGVHIGFGVGLGAANTTPTAFFVNVAPIVGVHFPVAERVIVNFDASLAFKIRSQGANQFDFSFATNSSLLGASVVYEL